MGFLNHFLEKTGEVQVNGGKIHYRYYEPHDVCKSSNIPLIVIHGGPGSSHALLYDGLLEISNERPTLYYDQLGSHFSPAKMNDDLINLDNFVDDLNILVDQLKLKKFSLLGHSFGGTLALAYSFLYQDKINSLILSSPLISSKVWCDDCAVLMKDIGYDASKLLELELSGKTNDKYFCDANDLFEKTYDRRNLDKFKNMLKKHGKKFNPLVYNKMWGKAEFACTGTLKSIDFFDRLHELKIPTHFLCGQYDSATPRTMKKAQNLVKGSTLKIFEDAGHLSFLSNHDEYIEYIKTL